jgi:hypothetical protein
MEALPMTRQRVALALTALLVAGCSGGSETPDFGPGDEFTFAIEKKGGGATQDFVSRLRENRGEWIVEQRMDDGTWQDVTCKEKCRLAVSSEPQIADLRRRARIGVNSFRCLQDVAFAVCKTQTRSGVEYFMVGGLEGGRPWPVRLVKIDPASFSPID